ncbi:MAG: T9SS type A sorting domain-containing protein [Flavobacteriales bacterium]|nr:T9SS type A sorting domain-containing protein [Flavobacteriales bacterium]
MNLHYTAILALLAVGTANGQWAQPRPLTPTLGVNEQGTGNLQDPASTGKGHQGTAKAAGDTVFYDDFANGLAGNNNVGAWSRGGPNGIIWKYDTDGPLGAFSNATEIITSTTAANGFMIFDADRANADTTVTPPTALPSFTTWDGYLVSPALDLTATPNVHLTFQMKMRWCCSTASGHFVDISSDGGATWPTRVSPVQEGHNTNVDPGTYNVYINMGPTVAGNPANVRFRIGWEGSFTTNMSHYHWQVDDVAIVESPTNDLVLKNTQHDDYFNDGNVFDGSSANIEYSIYPYSQLRELTLKSKVLNDGTATQTNVAMAVDVTNGGGTSVFTGTNGLASLAMGVTDSLQIDGFTPPTGVTDDYDVNFSLTSDATDDRPDDNAKVLSFQVKEFEYAYDLGSRSGRQGNTDTQGNPLEYSVGNVFSIVNDGTAYGVKIAVATNTTGQASPVGEQIQGTVYDGNLDPIAETDLYTITNANLNTNGQNKFITLPFLNGLNVTAGEELFVTMQYFGGTAPVYAATSGLSATAAGLLLDPAESTPLFLVSGRPMVRLTFDPSVGIEEADFQNGVGLGQCFPNPAADVVTIPFELKSGARVRMEMHDVSGKLVRVLENSTRAAGAHRLEVNVQNMNEGVYFYTLTAGDVRMTKRMTVVH